MSDISRSELRHQLRKHRQHLAAEEAQHAAQQLTKLFLNSPLFSNSHTLAAYLSHQGEINPIDIMQAAWELEKKVYIPVLHPEKTRHIQFVRWTPDTPLSTNRYGIFECEGIAEIIEPEMLELVLVPLVGFDEHCHRLGTGGGYYDRTFEFLKNVTRPTQPQLIGLAYEFQRREKLPVEEWDIPLDGVLTDKNFYVRKYL